MKRFNVCCVLNFSHTSTHSFPPHALPLTLTLALSSFIQSDAKSIEILKDEADRQQQQRKPLIELKFTEKSCNIKMIINYTFFDFRRGM